MNLEPVLKEINMTSKRKALLLKEIEIEEKALDRLTLELNIPRKKRDLASSNYTTKRISVDKMDYKATQQKIADLSYFDRIKPMISQIPESNGSKFYQKKNLNVAIITDEFMLNYYDAAANFIYLNNNNYKKITSSVKIDLFMFVTGWRGLNNDWKGIGSTQSKKTELITIIQHLKSLGIPTIFQSIEDPSNYENFIEIAKNCDYIFTTCVEKIDSYKKDCNNQNVWLLEFGVNPLFHNPIGFRKFKSFNEVLFAGSWAERYEERCNDMVKIFDGVIRSNKNLRIIDRNFDFNIPENFFPEIYLQYCSPSLPHTELQKVHKLYDWAINLNSIKYSQTMCAMRVYELQALGNIILSNYSVAVNNKFPNIFIINNSEEVESIINSFSDIDIYKHQIHGIRQVMSNCTVFDRFDYIMEKVFSHSYTSIINVLVIVDKITPKIKKMFDSQTYPHKKILEKETLSGGEYDNFDIITFFDQDIEYLEYYLEDLCNGFKYTSSKYITKHPDIDHDYTTSFDNKYLTAFWLKDFSLEEVLSFNVSEELEGGYSIDSFEYVKKGKSSVELNNSTTREYDLSVIVPVYNNGHHLLNKCFNSLKRSSIFERMEIILVDDGSTDNYTKLIIDRLLRDYNNVIAYFFEDNGSGSASRPRNKGIELATSRYITFLDPDNEAINDGYAKLIQEITNSDYDFVVGSIKKITDKEINIRIGNDQVVNSPREYLLAKKFQSQSVQAAVIDKQLIVDNNLEMVIGAIGQDTLFFHELMLCSNKIKIIDEPIHIYYGLVQDSAVNKINISFFEKSLLLEREAKVRYEKYGVLENYKNEKFEYFFKHWYLEKFKMVKSIDKERSAQILGEILTLYSDDIKLRNKDIIKFKKDYL